MREFRIGDRVVVVEGRRSNSTHHVTGRIGEIEALFPSSALANCSVRFFDATGSRLLYMDLDQIRLFPRDGDVALSPPLEESEYEEEEV